MTDDERKELCAQYQVMMGLAAWRHFEVNTLNRIEEQATKDEDNVPMEDLSIARIAECRGRRKAIDIIKNDLEYIIHGLK